MRTWASALLLCGALLPLASVRGQEDEVPIPLPGWEELDHPRPMPAVEPHWAAEAAEASETQSPIPPWGHEIATAPPTGPGRCVLPEHTFDADEVEAPPLFWARTEYLLWWTKNRTVPPLLTTGLTTARLPGALGQDQTKVLYGGDIAFHDRSGVRFTIGAALGRGSVWAVEANYFLLNARDTGLEANSPGTPLLARPFFNVLTNKQDASVVTYPNFLKGGIDINSRSYLQGFELNLQTLGWEDGKTSVEVLAGFRYLNLAESLTISEDTVGQQKSGIYLNKTLNVADRFGVDNDFYGAQLGFRAQHDYKRLRFGLLGKLALGTVQEQVDIRGASTVNGALVGNGGLYALSSNSGSHTHTNFAVVPEFGVSVGLRVTSWLTATAGYSFIYWSQVARPGDQLDNNVNPNLVPLSNNFGAGGPARPAFQFRESDYWAQGLNLGLEFRY